MKINKIELQNYRVHKDAAFEFGKGINLILGRNGAGKSSILEAAGIALFGADSRTSDKEAVKNGEKSAYILVEITGNDGIDYIVEKRIGSSSMHRIYPKDGKSEAVTGSENVFKKVAEISGIEKNTKKIYQNIVTAYQNKIVNIFSDTPKNREGLFNEIFDTAIYREMYQGYLKTALDRYITEKKIFENDIISAAATIEDSEMMEIGFKEKIGLEREKNREFENIKIECEKKEADLKKLENGKNKEERLKEEIKEREKTVEEIKNREEKNAEEIKIAEESLKIVNENRDKFINYGIVEKEIAEIEEKITAKEVIKKEIEKAEKKSEEEKRRVTEIIAVLGEKKLKSEEVKKNRETINGKHVNKKNDAEKLEEEIEKLNKICSENKNKKLKLEEYIERYEEVEKNIYDGNSRIKLIKESSNSLKEIKKEIEKFEIEYIEIKKEIENKKILENSIREYEIQREEILKASSILSGGNCPYLREKCMNILENKGFEDYFSRRIEEITKEIDENLKILKKFIESEKKYEKINNSIALLKEKEKNIEKQEIELKEIGLQNDVLEEKKRTIILMAVNEIDSREIISYKELKEIDKKIGMEIAAQLKEAEEKQKRAIEMDKELKEIEKELERENIKLKEITKEIENLEEEEKKSIKMIEIADKFIKERVEKTADLELLKDKSGMLKANREELKKGYELYSANIKTAETVDYLKKNLEELITLKELKIKEILEKKQEVNEINSLFNFEIIDELRKDFLEAKAKRDISYEELTSIKIECAKIEEKINENRRKGEKLKEKRKNLKKIEKKIEIMQKFRDNINSMGKAVASGLLASIENIATENFRKMTGREEEIKWINSEKESYAVYLKGKEENGTKFEVLSGGEQVAAALSLRAAMASVMSDADFAIFDEPTINLDKVRKEALAESLKEILKELEQAIIVTHDDLFEEMAERIIIVE